MFQPITLPLLNIATTAHTLPSLIAISYPNSSCADYKQNPTYYGMMPGRRHVDVRCEIL